MENTMNNFKFENTPGGKLLAELRQSVREMIVVPNSCLPVEFRDNVRGGRTLARLNEMCEKRDDTETEHVRKKRMKAINIERLAAQVESQTVRDDGGQFVDLDGELDYTGNESDEIQLHKNSMAMVGGMVNGGLIDADDFEEFHHE